MGTAAATRTLTKESYLTDGVTLVYVLDIAGGKPGAAVVIEDVRTGKVRGVPPDALDGWRFVTPEASDG